MTKIDIFSGFLGAGKTTLIKKLIKEAYKGENVVLIENEFGEIGIDGGFLQDAGINITEMNSGCICCSLVGDFAKALKKVSAEYSPDRIIIEPSGVGKLSDVISAVQKAEVENSVLNVFCTVVDANKCKMYMKNFGEFFNNQIENASCIVLSHTGNISEEKLSECVKMIKEHNSVATLVTTPWDKLSGESILKAMQMEDTLKAELKKLAEEKAAEEAKEHAHHHHHHDDDDDDDDEHEHCHHHHDDDNDDDEHEHCHHHHDDDDDDDDEHEHCHHHHDDDGDDDDDEHEHCHHHHEGHHHADDVFTSWGLETTHKFTEEELKNALSCLQDAAAYGTVLRAKGIVDSSEGEWIHFDYVPGEPDVRRGSAGVTGRLCVIGCDINEDNLKKLFKA